MGIEVPSPIQKLSIQPALDGKDIIAKAETGTGKTLAFGAPMMAKIDPARASVLAMVLCPTRELAQQVHDVLAELGLPRGIRTALIVGGDPLMPQVKALKAGAQVVVGTPGRVLDLYQQRFLTFPWTEFAVLDEADKMFEIGFLDDVRKILSYMPDERQTMLFSATYPREVLKLARESTRDPAEIATAKGAATVDSIDQMYMKIDEEDKSLALIRVLEHSDEEDVFLIFCERRTDVDRMMRRLERTRFSIKALHGGYDQAARFRVMSAFRTGEVKALVATDVASRGLDVKHVTHVVNVGVPRELEEYTHRIGRTGRAGRSGTAITFVSRKDFGRWKGILEKSGWDVVEAEAPGRHANPRNSSRAASEQGRSPEEREARPPRSRDRNEGEERPRRRRDPNEQTRSEERPHRRADSEEPSSEARPRRHSQADERPRRRARSDEASHDERPRRREEASEAERTDAPRGRRGRRQRSKKESVLPPRAKRAEQSDSSQEIATRPSEGTKSRKRSWRTSDGESPHARPARQSDMDTSSKSRRSRDDEDREPRRSDAERPRRRRRSREEEASEQPREARRARSKSSNSESRDTNPPKNPARSSHQARSEAPERVKPPRTRRDRTGGDPPAFGAGMD